MKNLKIHKAPPGLSPEASRFWRETVRDFVLEPHHLEVLRQACACLTRIGEAKELVHKEGLVVQNRHGEPRPHPGLEIEATNRRLFRVFLRELGLDVAAPDEGYTRMPRLAPHGPKKGSEGA